MSIQKHFTIFFVVEATPRPDWIISVWHKATIGLPIGTGRNPADIHRRDAKEAGRTFVAVVIAPGVSCTSTFLTSITAPWQPQAYPLSDTGVLLSTPR